MSKTGDTKRRILEMLNQKSETLTSISRKLDLAPSTVSQHLQEMVDEGMIKQVDDRPRKWKYYEVNKNRGIYVHQESHAVKRWRYAIPIAVIALLFVAAALFYTSTSQNVVAQQVYLSPGSNVPSGSTVFSVSDTPTSYNITGLFVTVDNLSIHSATTGKWYKVPLQLNNFNLIDLKNISKVLSGVKLKNGIYDEIVIHIKNVTTQINGTNETVYLPSDKLIVIGNFNITNSTTNWINIDFNLENSLHILKDGKIVMLPVLFVRHVNDNSLNVNQSTIIIAAAPGNVRELIESGMNMNGNMITNYTTSQNVSIAVLAGGQLAQNGTMNTPIIIRTRRSMFIGLYAGRILNISNYTNSNGSITANASTASVSAFLVRCKPVSVNETVSNSTAIVSTAGECCSYKREIGGAIQIVRICTPSRGAVPPIRIGEEKIIGTSISQSQLNNGSYITSIGTPVPVPITSGANLSNSSINISGNMGCMFENGALQCVSGK